MFDLNKKIWIVSYKAYDNCQKEVAILARRECKAINKFLKKIPLKNKLFRVSIRRIFL